MRKCRKCGKLKPKSEFWKRSKGDGLRRQCKACHHEYRSTPEFIRKRRAASRFKKYGLSEKGFRVLYKAQGGLCKICKVREATNVDHCHASKKVRGLLCGPCNLLLGHAKDDARVLRRAARYLEVNSD